MPCSHGNYRLWRRGAGGGDGRNDDANASSSWNDGTFGRYIDFYVTKVVNYFNIWLLLVTIAAPMGHFVDLLGCFGVLREGAIERF